MRDSRDAFGETTMDGATEAETVSADETLVRSPPAEASRSEDSRIGQRIGPYRIERLIARGGMGEVYLAQREDDFQQRVALKLIQPGKANLEVMSRFYDERQILGRLEHPGIARIFDGGNTDDAMPYFVMEYVEGEAIDRFCRALPLARRLELFLEVCEAVQFAHQSLVTHRDLKPSNILVTPEGRPKLLDFGIATPLHEESGDRAEGERKRYMTLAYAGPEQILGDPVTTASDIYALGVVLYRLLSDRHPYELPEGASSATLVQIVCEQDPPAPSLVAPPERVRRLAGDLDAITLKALRKKPEERYGAVAELADEIRRHLAHLPVRAHRGSWTYRARKTVRRNRLAFAGLIFAIAFSLTTTVLWRHAVVQQHAAEQAQVRAEGLQKQAERVSDFLAGLFESADPDHARGEQITLLDALDRGREKLTDELQEEPEIRAELLGTLGGVYNNLGFYDEALELKYEALETRRAADSRDRSELLIDLNNVGGIHYDRGDYAEAEKYFLETLAMARRLGDVRWQVFVLRNLAGVLIHRGEGRRAVEVYQDLLELQRSLDGEDESRLASSLYGLASAHRLLGEVDEAEPLLRSALEIYLRADASPRRIASVQGSLALTLLMQGRGEEARRPLEEALEIRLRIFGEDDIRTAACEKNLAAVLLDLGEAEAAGELLTSALATLVQGLPADDWRIAEAQSLWAVYLESTGRPAEGDALFQESVEGFDENQANQRLALEIVRRVRGRA